MRCMAAQRSCSCAILLSEPTPETLQALAPATHATHPLKGGYTELTNYLSICYTSIPAYSYTSKQADMRCSFRCQSLPPRGTHTPASMDLLHTSCASGFGWRTFMHELNKEGTHLRIPRPRLCRPWLQRSRAAICMLCSGRLLSRRCPHCWPRRRRRLLGSCC